MRRQHSVAAIVYNHLYPQPAPQDPQDFSQYLIRHLITEVRIETQRFYGGLDTIEAKYPGLNYSHPPHRKRLARFHNHARLFRAFDDLGLTGHEISELCKWEGTLWARQRYERDEGIRVMDTTATEIKPYVERRPEFVSRKRTRELSVPRDIRRPQDITVQTDIAVEVRPKDHFLNQSYMQWQLQQQYRTHRPYHTSPPRFNQSPLPNYHRRNSRLGPLSPRRSQARSFRFTPNRPEEMLPRGPEELLMDLKDAEMIDCPADFNTPPALSSGSEASESPFSPPADELSADELSLHEGLRTIIEPCINEVSPLEASRGQLSNVSNEESIMEQSFQKEEVETQLLHPSGAIMVSN